MKYLPTTKQPPNILPQNQQQAAGVENPDTLQETNPAPPARQSVGTIADDAFVTPPAQNSALGADELVSMRKLTSGIDTLDLKSVEKELGKTCKAEAKNSEIAVKASVMVTTYAWITGKLILRAKSLLKKKGEFGDWCESNLVKPGLMSVKTAQRYMVVAKKWDSLDALLAGVPNLWGAYQDAGVLPVPDDSGDAENPEIAGNGEEAPKIPPASQVAQYVAEFSKLQNMLRRLKEMRKDVAAALPDEEQDKIDLIIEQIIKFASQLSNKTA